MLDFEERNDHVFERGSFTFLLLRVGDVPESQPLHTVVRFTVTGIRVLPLFTSGLFLDGVTELFLNGICILNYENLWPSSQIKMTSHRLETFAHDSSQCMFVFLLTFPVNGRQILNITLDLLSLKSLSKVHMKKNCSCFMWRNLFFPTFCWKKCVHVVESLDSVWAHGGASPPPRVQGPTSLQKRPRWWWWAQSFKHALCAHKANVPTSLVSLVSQMQKYTIHAILNLPLKCICISECFISKYVHTCFGE